MMERTSGKRDGHQSDPIHATLYCCPVLCSMLDPGSARARVCVRLQPGSSLGTMNHEGGDEEVCYECCAATP